MLNALSVHFRGFTVDAEGEQEPAHDAVAFAGMLGECSALVREKDGAVSSLSDQPVPRQALQRAVDRRRRNAGALGKVDGAGLTGGIDQVRDQLDIVLGGLLLMRPPYLLEAPRLPLGLS